jgi:hypothetical protein
MVSKIATLEERVDWTIQGVKRSFDPKYQTEQHPWLAIGLSVAAGYLLSGLILGRPAPRTELVLPKNWDERTADKQATKTGMLASVTGMLSGVVTATAVSLAREYASGVLFKRHQNGRGNEEELGVKARDERVVTFPG